MKNYEVIYELGLVPLEQAVNLWLSKGYLCAGGVSSHQDPQGNHWYMQAVYQPI